MLLCSIDEVEPGARLGASVLNVNSPEVELLKAGVTLDRRMLERLRRLGIAQLWIEHDITADLDAAIAPNLTAARVAVYAQLRRNLDLMAKATVSTVQVHAYRQTLMELACEIVGSGRFAGLADQLFSARSDLFTHGANVAYLSILVGLELETYIVRERSRLSSEHARDYISLGLGAMLHDIGKLGGGSALADCHEAHCALDGERNAPVATDGDDEGECGAAYREHTITGYQMLRDSRAPASATQAVLHHHQRFDGSGWPDLAETGTKGREGALEGRRIHIFTRIVSAANVLDNLMRSAEGAQRPVIAALYDFASPRFNGWFDPVVRRAVLRRIPPFAVGSKVMLNDGRAGVVTSPNVHEPCRPAVRLLEPDSSQDDEAARTIPLQNHPELFIRTCAGVDVIPWLFTISPPKAEAA